MPTPLEFGRIGSDILVSWITIGALILAGIIGWREYEDQKKQNQTTETLKYVRTFSTKDLIEARINLSLHWGTKEFRKKWRQLTVQTQSDTQENREMKFSDLMAAELRENNLSTNFFKLVDFYESLWICIKEEICNEDVALSYFAETTWRQFAWYYAYLKHKSRKVDPTFGKKFEKFAYASRTSIQKNRAGIQKGAASNAATGTPGI